MFWGIWHFKSSLSNCVPLGWMCDLKRYRNRGGKKKKAEKMTSSNASYLRETQRTPENKTAAVFERQAQDHLRCEHFLTRTNSQSCWINIKLTMFLKAILKTNSKKSELCCSKADTDTFIPRCQKWVFFFSWWRKKKLDYDNWSVLLCMCMCEGFFW